MKILTTVQVLLILFANFSCKKDHVSLPTIVVSQNVIQDDFSDPNIWSLAKGAEPYTVMGDTRISNPSISIVNNILGLGTGISSWASAIRPFPAVDNYDTLIIEFGIQETQIEAGSFLIEFVFAGNKISLDFSAYGAGNIAKTIQFKIANDELVDFSIPNLGNYKLKHVSKSSNPSDWSVYIWANAWCTPGCSSGYSRGEITFINIYTKHVETFKED